MRTITLITIGLAVVGLTGAHAQEATTPISLRYEALEARLDIRDAQDVLARAEAVLADARLRQSAARTGQARKGRGNPLSIANPGSRRRWDEAVAAADVEVAAATVGVEKAAAARLDVIARHCREGQTQVGCPQ